MEGIESVWHDEMTDAHLWKDYSGKSNGLAFARMSFFSLWDKIKGTGSAKMNPWVWVIKFKVLTINGDIKWKRLNARCAEEVLNYLKKGRISTFTSA